MFHVLLALSAALAPPNVPLPELKNVAPAQTKIAPGVVRTVRLGPDIVVKEIRKDGSSNVRALIANVGTADVTVPFQLAAFAAGPSFTASTAPLVPLIAGPLKAGASQWVRIGPFFTLPPAPGRAVSLSELTNVSVDADVYSGGSGGLGGPGPLLPGSWPSSSSGSGAGKTCTPEHGCVVETDETNNSLTVPVATMADWTGG